MTNFKDSETAKNLMRAFAGESQARNRYTFAAEIAGEQNQAVIEGIFRFTADQEKEHADVFYNHLKELTGEEITVDGDYPVNLTKSVLELLRYAESNEQKEYAHVYASFAKTAKEEGFAKIATDFENIAKIEKSHSERFKKFADLLESGKLFLSDVECGWMCLNCGNIINTKGAPPKCPVCDADQGFFIRLTLAPFEE